MSLLTWPRTTSSMAEDSWSATDIAETSRKAAGWNQAWQSHICTQQKNAEPSQNVTNLELQSSTHTPPVLHDVESSGLLLFPFCLCFGTLCCLSGSFPRLPLHAWVDWVIPHWKSTLQRHGGHRRDAIRRPSGASCHLYSFVNLCCSCILTWTCHISSLHGSVLCRSQICAEAAVNLQRNGVSMTVYIMTQKASRNSQMISIKDSLRHASTMLRVSERFWI